MWGERTQTVMDPYQHPASSAEAEALWLDFPDEGALWSDPTDEGVADALPPMLVKPAEDLFAPEWFAPLDPQALLEVNEHPEPDLWLLFETAAFGAVADHCVRYLVNEPRDPMLVALYAYARYFVHGMAVTEDTRQRCQRLLDEAGAADPNARTWHACAIACYLLGDDARCVQYCDQALRTHPHVASVYITRGCALLRRGEPGRAWNDGATAHRLRPLGRASDLMGRASARLGRLAEAMEMFLRCHSECPAYADAYHGYVRVYIESVDEDVPNHMFDRLDAMLGSAIRLSPRSVAYRVARAELYMLGQLIFPVPSKVMNGTLLPVQDLLYAIRERPADGDLRAALAKAYLYHERSAEGQANLATIVRALGDAYRLLGEARFWHNGDVQFVEQDLNQRGIPFSLRRYPRALLAKLK